MIITNLKRVMRAGFFNFARNGFVSMSAVLVMVVALSVVASVVFTSAILNSSLEHIRDKVDVNVYFVTGAPEGDVLSLRESLEALPEVERVTYVSKEEALEDFRARHANDSTTLDALEELDENPLGAVLNIKANNPSQYEGIANFLEEGNFVTDEGAPIIDKVNFFQNKAAIDALSRLISSAEKLGLIFSIVLVVVSIIITFNTIRLVIYVSREEISVMQLVGASKQYIRGPFVVSGLIYGLVAGVITMSLLYPATYWLGRTTNNFFAGINLFDYYASNFGQIFLIVVGSGLAIGAVSSYLAVRKYLA